MRGRAWSEIGWKPLGLQGFDVKLFVGSHVAGCGRLFASEKSGIKDLWRPQG